MKESTSSPWFATRLLNTGTTTSRRRPEKQTPPFRVGSCCTAPEHNHPSSLNYSSFASSFSCHHGSPVTSPSPFRSSLVVIPFSWEKQPGVPKHSFSHHHHRQPSRAASSFPKLPLPPPLRSNSDPFLSATRRKKKQDRRPAEDPFVLAMLECSREDRLYTAADEDPAGGLCWKGSPAAALKAAGGRRKAARERFGLVDLYGSCKTTCSVASSAVRVPRPGRAVEAYGLLARRAR